MDWTHKMLLILYRSIQVFVDTPPLPLVRFRFRLGAGVGPPQNNDTSWQQHCVLWCCPSMAKHGNIAVCCADTINVSEDFRNIFCVRTNVAHVAKQVNIWETWSRQQFCRHNVSSFCRPSSPKLGIYPPNPGLILIYSHSSLNWFFSWFFSPRFLWA